MDWQQTDKRHEPPVAAACCDCLYKPRHPPLLGDSRNLSFTRTIVIRPALCSSQKMSKRMATASIDLTIAIARTMSFTCATESRPLRRVFSMIRVIRFSFGAMLISSSSCGITCDVMLMLGGVTLHYAAHPYSARPRTCYTLANTKETNMNLAS